MLAVPANPSQLPMLCEYIREKTGMAPDPALSQGFAILDDSGQFAAALVVSNVRFVGDRAIDCELSGASDSNLAGKPWVRNAVLQYIFGQLGCARCTAITRKNNTKARAFLEALNFTLEGRLRRGYDGEKDALIYGLLAEDCGFSEG